MNLALKPEQMEYDQRQFRMMNHLLNSFESGEVGLDHFISNMESLLKLVNDPDSEWKNKYHAEWAKIEDTYAVALDKGDKTMPIEEREYILNAVSRIRQLVNDKLTDAND